MNATDKIDAARIELLLGELRLPGIKLIWTALAETADKEGWPAARFLAAGILALVVSPLLVVLGVAWVVWRVARAACGARRADVGARMAG